MTTIPQIVGKMEKRWSPEGVLQKFFRACHGKHPVFCSAFRKIQEPCFPRHPKNFFIILSFPQFFGGNPRLTHSGSKLGNDCILTLLPQGRRNRFKIQNNSFEFGGFGFVSDFEIRASYLLASTFAQCSGTTKDELEVRLLASN